MKLNQYAVVRNSPRFGVYSFSSIYDDYNVAKIEAERLCGELKAEFWVIQVVGKCGPTGVIWQQ